MTVYKLSADPKCAVWDRKGNHWTFDETLGMYRCEGQRVRNTYWYELLGTFGPLTDIKIPGVGETITITRGDSLSAEDAPEGAVFVCGNAVYVRIGNVFEINGSDSVRRFLPLGGWTRLR